MIKNLLAEIDKSINQNERNNQLLLSLIGKIISLEKRYDPELIQLCYDIHELDTDIAESLEIATEEGLRHPSDFVKGLIDLKKRHHILWEKKEK